MLKTLGTALPRKGRPAVIEHCDLAVLLVPSGKRIYAERHSGTGQVGFQPHSSNADTLSINEVVLPNDITAIGFEIQLGMNLVSGKPAGNAVFASTAYKAVLTKHYRGNCQHQAPANRNYL